MKASEIILSSTVCRQASINIYPQDPDELFNTCWLAVREKEISCPDWKPDSPKHYFLRMMRNKVVDWRKKKKLVNIDQISEATFYRPALSSLPSKAYVIEWINERTDNEDLLFLKNIITLALYSKEINHAIKLTGISRTAFWRWHKIAKKQLHDDYHASNPDHVPSLVMV